MDVNEIICAKQTQFQWSWYETLTSGNGLEAVYALASSFNNGRRCVRGYDECGAWIRKGGYNVSFWVEFDDSTKWVIRFPMVGAIAPELVDEKLETEVATMLFISEKTTIQIPQLIGYGLTNNRRHPRGLPFLILTHMHGKPLPVLRVADGRRRSDGIKRRRWSIDLWSRRFRSATNVGDRLTSVTDLTNL